MKAENQQSLGRAERMMVRCMCGVSLKDRIIIITNFALK